MQIQCKSLPAISPKFLNLLLTPLTQMNIIVSNIIAQCTIAAYGKHAYFVFRDPFANLEIISPSSSSSSMFFLLPLAAFFLSALSLSLNFCSALRCFFSAFASFLARRASSSDTRSLTIVLSMCSSVLRPKVQSGSYRDE